MKQLFRTALENYKVSHKQMTTDETKMFLNLIIGDAENFHKILSKDPIYNIILKRIEVYNLEEYIHKDCVLFIYLFAGGNPGKAVLMLIDILNLSKSLNRQIQSNDIGVELYPTGFYDDISVECIIDNLLKPRKVYFSEIY